MKNKTGYIYVNGRFLCNKMDGISRFSLEICKQLKKLNLDFKIIIPNWLDYDNKEGFDIVKYGHLKSHFWEQIDLLRFLKSLEKPLLLNLSGLGPLFYKNQIITIHDLAFYNNKKWFSKVYTFFYSHVTPILANNASKILTVSEFSKTEIIKYLKIDKNKIIVIYNAVSSDFKDSSIDFSSPIIVGKYILAVSSIDPRKNLQRLINVFTSLNIKGYKMILVGKTSKHFNVTLSNSSKNVVFTGFVSDAELSNLYKNCDFFIYPSLYEGFGIPPLEAMKNGCAVIVSKIPSLVEVCADGAFYIDPYDDHSIKEAILKIINDPMLKTELQSKSKIRADVFNWDKSGHKVYELINECLK